VNVIDASAVLAVIRDEPGSTAALPYFDSCLISAVNLAEVLQKATQYGMDTGLVRTLLGETEIGVVPFDDEMAESTARLWPLTRHNGLSLADRACLALAEAANGIAVTTDKAWAELDLPGIDIHVLAR
jgi:ribonuclease VapC